MFCNSQGRLVSFFHGVLPPLTPIKKTLLFSRRVWHASFFPFFQTGQRVVKLLPSCECRRSNVALAFFRNTGKTPQKEVADPFFSVSAGGHPLQCTDSPPVRIGFFSVFRHRFQSASRASSSRDHFGRSPTLSPRSQPFLLFLFESSCFFSPVAPQMTPRLCRALFLPGQVNAGLVGITERHSFLPFPQTPVFLFAEGVRVFSFGVIDEVFCTVSF